MTATGALSYLWTDGLSVDVTLTSHVDKGDVAYVEGFLGIANDTGDSGGIISLNIDLREYQFTVPAALSVAKGATVWIDTTVLTGHKPGDAAYFTASGSNRVRLFRATTAKDSNNTVTGKLLGGLGLT